MGIEEVKGDERMSYELTNEGFKAKVGSFEIVMYSNGVFEDVVEVKRNGKELFTIAFPIVSQDYKIHPVMIIDNEYIGLDVFEMSNYPDEDGLAQEMYFNEIYAYVLERIIEEMEYEEQEKL
jgi:hypothetical protein